MTTKDLRRVWRRTLSAEALAASQREERIALATLRRLVAMGAIR